MATVDESEADEQWQWVTVAQAVELTGLSAATLRRRIRDFAAVTLPDGTTLQLQAKRYERPQGSVFTVRLPASLGVPTPDESADESAPVTPESSPQAVAELRQLLAEVGQQWLEPVLAEVRDSHTNALASATAIGDLRARLELTLVAKAALRDDRDEQAARVRELELALALATAEAERLRAAQASWWRRLFPWLAS